MMEDTEDDAYVIRPGRIAQIKDPSFFDNTYIKFEEKPETTPFGVLQRNSVSDNPGTIYNEKTDIQSKGTSSVSECLTSDLAYNHDEKTGVECSEASIVSENPGNIYHEETSVQYTDANSVSENLVYSHDGKTDFECPAVGTGENNIDIVFMAADLSQIQTFDTNPTDQTDSACETSIESEWKLDCDYCFSQFSTETELQAHIDALHVYTQSVPHGCGICLRDFKTLPELRTHILALHDELDKVFYYMCMPCVKVFRNLRDFEVHRMEKVAELDIRIGVPCEHWMKVYVDAREGKYDKYSNGYSKLDNSFDPVNGDSRDSELYNVTSSRNLGLSTMTYGAVRSQNRPSETRIPNPKSYHCRICDHSCNSLRALSLHEQAHSVPTSYRCRICQVYFHSSRDLMTHHKSKRHMDKWSNVAPVNSSPYKCPTCGKRFESFNKLSSHQRLHVVVKSAVVNEESHNGTSLSKQTSKNSTDTTNKPSNDTC